MWRVTGRVPMKGEIDMRFRTVLRVAALATAGVLVLMLAAPAFATPKTDNGNWRVYTIKAATNTWANMSKAKEAVGSGVSFPVQTFSAVDSGLFSVYLSANAPKIDVSGLTISATVGLTLNGPAQFWTRSTACDNTGDDAYVRLEFQSVTSGPYSASDYWWSTGSNSVNLSDLATSGPTTLSVAIGDGSNWSNIDGQLGTDDPTGFANAIANVKQIGVAFGSACRYASGFAVSGATGTFDLLGYTVS